MLTGIDPLCIYQIGVNHLDICVLLNPRAKNLPTFFGHKAGFDRLEEIILYAVEKGISNISCFVFSTENFKRDEAEVSYLMKLFCDNFARLEDIFLKENIRVIFSGRKTQLQQDVILAMQSLEQKTADCSKATANVCLNYQVQPEFGLECCLHKITFIFPKQSVLNENTKQITPDCSIQQNCCDRGVNTAG